MKKRIDIEKLKQLLETGQKLTREELASNFGVGVTALSPAFNILESRYPVNVRKKKEPNNTKFVFYIEPYKNDSETVLS